MRLDPSFKAQFISNRSSHEHDAINHITWPIRTLDQENEDVDALSVLSVLKDRHKSQTLYTQISKPFFLNQSYESHFLPSALLKTPTLDKIDQDLIFTSSCSRHFSGHGHKIHSIFSCCVFLIFFIFESLPFSADAPQDLPSKAANAASCQNKPRQKNRQAVKITSAKSFTCHDLKCFILDFCALNKCHTYFGKINVCCTSCNNWHYQCQLIQTKITLKTVHAII